MKKVLVGFFIALSALLVFSPHSIQALDMIDYPSGKSLLGQQNQSYSVVFRGNGEAVVSAKFIISNIADTPIKQISLRVPKVEAQDVIAFQVIKERLCARYEVSNSVSIESSYVPPSRCLEYQQPDYYYDYSNNKYQKATTEIQCDTILVILPTPIESNASGSFILYYSAFGYAKKNIFGAFDFAFETLKVDDRTNNLTVGITTDSDLLLKGANAAVNYRFTEDAVAQLKSTSSFAAPTANSSVDYYYQQIGQGSITKTASSLQPLDSYTVKGSYAGSVLSLYAKELLITIFIFLFIIMVLVKFMKGKSGILKLSVSNSLVFTIPAVSFVSAFLTLIYTLAIIFISQLGLFGYYYGSLQTVFFIFILIISIVVYILFVLVPAIFIGIKKGLWAGVATLILTIIWLVLFLFIIFMIFFIANNNNYPYPLKTEPVMY